MLGIFKNSVTVYDMFCIGMSVSNWWIVDVSVTKYRHSTLQRAHLFGSVVMFVFDQYIMGLLYPEWFFNKYFSGS